MSPYESLYWSWWNHPLACWISAALLLPLILRRLSFLHAYMVLGLALTCADALVTGMWSKLGGESSWLYTPLSFVFVVAGDWRVHWLVQREVSRTQDAPWGGLAASRLAFVIAILPSLAVELGKFPFPDALAQSRVMYLFYELWALAILTTIQGIYIAKWLEGRPAPYIMWIRGVVGFAQAHYLLWALSDMIILSGYDMGYALRIVPNVMYYALYLPAVWLLAPVEERDGRA
jgi:hypothetical protein